jgi:hypothetical protein
MVVQVRNESVGDDPSEQPAAEETEGEDTEVIGDPLNTTDAEIGTHSRRVAVELRISEILEEQKELQGPQGFEETISGASIIQEWQGRDPNHPSADFFRRELLPDGKILVIVGDFKGKGVEIPAGQETDAGQWKYDGGEIVCTLHKRLTSSRGLDTVNKPDDAIRLIDNILNEKPGGTGPDMLDGRFFVMTALVIDPSTRTVEGSVYGGFPTVFIREPDGKIQAIKSEGPPMGIFPLEECPVSSFSNLPTRTEILLMTDGLTDVPLPGRLNSYGLSQEAGDLLGAEDNDFFKSASVNDTTAADIGREARENLFSSDSSKETSLPRLVELAKESRRDDWGYVRISL